MFNEGGVGLQAAYLRLLCFWITALRAETMAFRTCVWTLVWNYESERA